MRRLDIRPLKKLRNPARHLRSLARWPDRIVKQLPAAPDLAGDRFWNFNVPVFSKVVEPPHATAEMQRACIAAIFAAAEAVGKSGRRPPGSRVACLVTTPFLFQSEVTLFFDDDYFRTFLPPAKKSRTDYAGGWVEAEAADVASIGDLIPPAPEALEFRGGTWMREVDEAWERDSEKVNWVWAFERR